MLVLFQVIMVLARQTLEGEGHSMVSRPRRRAWGARAPLTTGGEIAPGFLDRTRDGRRASEPCRQRHRPCGAGGRCFPDEVDVAELEGGLGQDLAMAARTPPRRRHNVLDRHRGGCRERRRGGPVHASKDRDIPRDWPWKMVSRVIVTGPRRWA